MALSLGFALMVTPDLFLRGLIGALGMYAVTDGVYAALSQPRGGARYMRLEGVMSLLLGIAIMLGAETQRGLLLLFALRGLLVSATELGVARMQVRGRELFQLRSPDVYRDYAAASIGTLSLGLLLLGYLGYGALDLYAVVAGQLALWACLLIAHMRRLGPWATDCTDRELKTATRV